MLFGQAIPPREEDKERREKLSDGASVDDQPLTPSRSPVIAEKDHVAANGPIDTRADDLTNYLLTV
jgi:hypothetical protein